MVEGSADSSTNDAAPPSATLPKMPKNHRNRCKAKAVVRYEKDQLDQWGDPVRRGDPVLDWDHARTYRACEAWGAHGTDFCGVHGGSAPQTIAAAKRRLALSADEVAAVIIEMAGDKRVSPDVRVKAAAQVLDRIGIRLGVDVSLEVPKWQKLIGKMFGNESGEGDNESESVEPAEEVAAVEEVPRPRKAPVAKPSPRKGMARKASRSGSAPKFEGW